jgi:hypothetical protein
MRDGALLSLAELFLSPAVDLSPTIFTFMAPAVVDGEIGTAVDEGAIKMSPWIDRLLKLEWI